MPKTIALIPVQATRTTLGLPSRVGEVLDGRTVLARTVERASRIAGVEAVVLVHRTGEDVLQWTTGAEAAVPVCATASDGWDAPYLGAIRAARRWAWSAWRGGIGGATVFDELLPAGPLVQAMDQHQATSAILLGADWPVVDPELCSGVLGLHLEAPESMKVTFSQAPPGLCGVAVSRDMLDDLARNRGTFAQVLRYNPRLPTPDPIGRDVCFQIPAAIRGDVRRFVYDTARGCAALRERLGLGVDAKPQAAADPGASWVTLELTPRRAVNGPIVPQHHVAIDRPDMPVDVAQRIVEQIGAWDDAALMLGGLGDPLLHPHWSDVVTAARAGGVRAIGVQTDLHCEDASLAKLLQLPIDVVWIRLNADSPATYARTMGSDAFDAVIKRIEWLYNHRGAARGGTGLPWLVPSMVKTVDTLGELESFFNRWMHYAGHAVVEPATSGCGLMPEQSPVPMAPPRRVPCRQLGQRMTIHSDGRVALCDQDWLGRAVLGDATATSLVDVWRQVAGPVAEHAAGRWPEPLCTRCHEWHRP